MHGRKTQLEQSYKPSLQLQKQQKNALILWYVSNLQPKWYFIRQNENVSDAWAVFARKLALHLELGQITA